MSARTLAFLVSLLVITGCNACGRANSRRDAGRAASPRATYRLAFVTDMKGYLEPCGCTSRPLGGVHRLGGILDRLAGDHVPTVLVGAGDTFFRGPSTDDSAQQDRWQAETLVDVLNSIGVAALVPGKRDLAQDAGYLATLEARARFPFLGTEPAGTSTIGLAPSQLVDVGGTKLGLIGVSDLFDATHDALVATAQASVASVRAAGARQVIALVRGDRRLGRAIGLLEGVDFVVLGGIDNEVPEPPTPRGNSFVLEGGYQGQRVIVVDVFLRNTSAMRDESRWTRQAERARIVGENTARRAQITAWSSDPQVSRADLDAQRAILATAEARLRELEREPDLSHGNAFSAEAIELAAGAPERASIAQIEEALAVRVNDHNRTALAAAMPPPVESGSPFYIGSQSCRSCHASAFEWWRNHQHGRAYATLQQRHREFNLQCVGCHVTGYGRPGGTTVVHNLDGALVNVGCESCHGPGSTHRDTQRAGDIRRAVPESTCLGCHTHEHSDRFNYDAYRARILVPGHGAPPGASP